MGYVRQPREGGIGCRCAYEQDTVVWQLWQHLCQYRSRRSLHYITGDTWIVERICADHVMLANVAIDRPVTPQCWQRLQPRQQWRCWQRFVLSPVFAMIVCLCARSLLASKVDRSQLMAWCWYGFFRFHLDC